MPNPSKFNRDFQNTEKNVLFDCIQNHWDI